MLPLSHAEFREAVMFFSLAVIAAIAWYFGYVRPNDQFLGAVMDCMGTDSSRAAYELCVTTLRR